MSDDTLVAALARAQAKFGPVLKSHTNPHFGSKYADLADVLGVVRPALAAEGIAIVQPIEVDTDTGHSFLVTRLLFADDALESRMPLQIDQKAQDLGSRLTYLRRFQLSALVGVAAEDDDDGNAANEAPTRTRTPRERTYVAERTTDSPQPAGNLPATDKQQGAIVAKLKTCGASKRDEQVALLKHLTGFDSVKALTKQQASDVIDQLAPYEAGQEWGMFVYSNGGAVGVVNVGEEPFEMGDPDGSAPGFAS